MLDLYYTNFYCIIMVEANIWEISDKLLWFEIKLFSDIGRALNLIKKGTDLNGESIDLDRKIWILKLILESSRQEKIQWKKPNFHSFLQVYREVVREARWDSDYAICLRTIWENFEALMKDTKFDNTKSAMREKISKSLISRSNYASASSRIEGKQITV